MNKFLQINIFKQVIDLQENVIIYELFNINVKM